ncbi:MAG TPA: T9SS type A sorting domain-containing protein [Candidatus Cloacimonadota bacterium]|nr:T9SS type A sorting domain-containing protein [Candidatus Cloacimonadota bacterium]
MRAFPNPFNPSTTVTFSLPVSGAVSLSLYNPKGQKLMHLASGEYKAGTHSISLDGAKLSSGVYLLRLETPGTHLIRKITLMK